MAFISTLNYQGLQKMFFHMSLAFYQSLQLKKRDIGPVS